MTAARGAYGVFAITLAGAVDPQRCGRLVFIVGHAALAIEHIVGGVMHEWHAMRRTPARNHTRRLCIGRKRSRCILFGPIDRSVCGRIDHHRRLQAIKQCRQAVWAAEVSYMAGAAIGQLAAAGGGDHLSIRRERA
ncbi:hypothetical protein D3C73_1317780 [compost metagenome]